MIEKDWHWRKTLMTVIVAVGGAAAVSGCVVYDPAPYYSGAPAVYGTYYDHYPSHYHGGYHSHYRGRRGDFPGDRDNNPPGPRGGPGTNWENPPGPRGGPGASPDRRRWW